VIEAIAREFDVAISVDTSSAAVMRESAAAGAHIINDVRSLRREGALAAAVASRLPVCLMHMVGEPTNMQNNPHYDDVVSDVADFFAATR
jgi:dihydropteroate synthase